MTFRCTECGTPMGDEDVCGRCGHRIAPWVIRLRDPRPAAPPADPELLVGDGGAPDAVRRGVGLIAAGVIVILVLVAVGARLYPDGDDGADVAAEAAPTTLDTTLTEVLAERTEGTQLVEATTTTVPPTTAAVSTTTSTSPTTTTTTSTTTTTAVPASGEVRWLSSSFQGGWVAQLASVPDTADHDDLEEEYQRLATHASGVVVADSSEWESLTDGYFVFVVPGPFDSDAEVREFCASVQVECIPRELTGRR